MNWGLSSLLHVMHMCREANLASSSSWMYIAYNYLLISVYPFIDSSFRTKRGEKFICFCFYFNPFVDDWQKGGEVFEIYACFPCLRGSSIYVYAYMFVLQIGEKEFDLFYAWVHVYLLHLHTCLCASLHIYFSYLLCMS